jgi:uncharacterized membrane protein
MVLAALDDTTYHALLLLHIVAVIVAFAPAAVNPYVEAKVRKAAGDAGVVEHYRYASQASRQVHFPALILAGLFGGAMIGASKTNGEIVWKFEQTWVWSGILTWVLLCGVVSAMIIPGEKAVAGGDASAAAKVARGGGLATVLLLIQLYLMIFKPGL